MTEHDYMYLINKYERAGRTELCDFLRKHGTLGKVKDAYSLDSIRNTVMSTLADLFKESEARLSKQLTKAMRR
jgi:LPS sulfotransferase NodH